VNLTLPSSTGTCAAPANDRTNCGLADMLAMVAQEDIQFGDPSSSGATIRRVQALMLAGRDASMLSYTSEGTCCEGTANPLDIAGSLIAGRQFAMIRDWAYPADDRHGRNQRCDLAAAGCRPVTLLRSDPADPSRPHPYCAEKGWLECWVFMKLGQDGRLVPNEGLKHRAFLGGCEPPAVDPDARCPLEGQRRITHFRLTLNHDARARTSPSVIPSGLPGGGGSPLLRLGDTRWKDCGSNNPSCS
jgi:hypothetical protein